MHSSTLKNILLVDDDVDHLCLCSVILSRQRYAVRTMPGCNNFNDLVNMVHDFRPALIFMDHSMPGISGLEATRLLKANPLYARIPIIYFSGQDDVVQLAAAAGADECLRKNFYMPQLLELTAKYIA